MKRIIIIAIAALFSFGQGAWAQEEIEGLTYKKDEGYYEISSAENLNALAKYVNDGNITEGKTFKMTDNITFGDEDTFTPIGYGDEENGGCFFRGTFDGGQDLTISGIKYRDEEGVGVGLFGSIWNPAVIKNMNLKNCSFIGNWKVGAIVGASGGSDKKEGWGIFNCTVYENVSVEGAAMEEIPSSYVGGIIGYCKSLTVNNCYNYANVEGDEYVGAIAGYFIGDASQESIIDDCYFTSNVDKAVGGRGTEDGMVTDATDGIFKITLLDDDSEPIKNEKRIENYNGQTVQVTLKDRTLFKDGAWNTICLPFDIKTSGETPFEGTPFEGATVKKFSGSSLVENSNGEQTGGEETGDENAKTLKLNFEENNATSIEAGVPYMVKWEKSTNVSDPVFENVEIKKAEETESATTQESSVDFVGSFSPVTLTANDHSVLYMGADNKLYYPSTDVTIGSFRAYFKLNGITVEPKTDPAPENSINNFVLNFGDDMTGISLINHRSSVTSDSWFTLDGRKLSGQPTAKGIYINHGHKVIIK